MNVSTVIIDRFGVLPSHRNKSIAKKSLYEILIHLLKLNETTKSIRLMIFMIPMNSFIETKLLSIGFERFDSSYFSQINVNSYWGSVNIPLVGLIYKLEQDNSLNSMIEYIKSKIAV